MKWALLIAALLIGTVRDRRPPFEPHMRDGYMLLPVDFHVHSFPFSWSSLAPWDLVLEAPRQGLEAIAIAGHNHTWVGEAGRWFSRQIGGILVLRSEEVHPPSGHVIAVGIDGTVEWDRSSEAIIDDIHRQGGVAIAAHPTKKSWARWPDAAVRKLDGSEVDQPVTILNPSARREMLDFHARTGKAAIGSSDYHGLGPLGICRTCVLVREYSEAAIVEAVRAGRTIVGHPCPAPPPPAPLARLSSALGLAALLLIVLRPGSRRR
ncbi:MAG TPA: PHP-associated domain-containing protein [Candidatus Solibacter sp.]|nr:PHP-associated domain-containing protein [Candidatus Solibacter sp.]